MAFYFFLLAFQIRVTSTLLNGFIPLSQAVINGYSNTAVLSAMFGYIKII